MIDIILSILSSQHFLTMAFREISFLAVHTEEAVISLQGMLNPTKSPIEQGAYPLAV